MIITSHFTSTIKHTIKQYILVILHIFSHFEYETEKCNRFFSISKQTTVIPRCAVIWDVDSLDWKDPAPEDITARVLKRVQPGSIVLFHNAAKNTPAALPGVIEGLIRQGYTIVPASQLILRENYTMDHTGRQIPGQS